MPRTLLLSLVKTKGSEGLLDRDEKKGIKNAKVSVLWFTNQTSNIVLTYFQRQ